ncbi:alpha/beta fold hydrolase [Hyphomonas sp.]|uniref:alpha/beta fold hydrolase n=1 Tax=Hyphomonas sp. TaxID=87 RepID=UPI003918D596
MIVETAIAVSALGFAAGLNSAAYSARVEKAFPREGMVVPVNGRDMHVIARGPETAAPVLLIHGASANAREFTSNLAPRLEGDFRVLMADRPGHGWSQRFAGAERLGAQAAQMAGVLEQVTRGQKAVIAGHSFGGAVALRLALDRPDLVAGLVLLAPVTHDWGDGSGTAWYNSFAAAPVAGNVFSQAAPLAGPAQMRSGVASVFHPAPAPPDYYETSGVGLFLRPANFRANARDMTALKAELAAQSIRYPEITAPVTVFSGSKDRVLSPKLHTARLKKQLKLDLVILPEEGHMPHHGHADAVASAISRLAIRPETR